MAKASVQKATWLRTPQTKLGQTGLVVLITLVNTIMPFTTDMYTPAIPSLPEYFGTTEQLVNLTLVGFFMFMTVAMLVCGPLSDRLGRRPVFVAALAVYVVGSLLCAASATIGMLVLARIVQSLGAGGVIAVSTALVKDCFVEARREQMIAILQVLGVLGPVVSPLLGGVLLRFFSWRASFVFLCIFGAVGLVMALLFEESLPESERRSGGLASTMGGLVQVARNRAFMLLLSVVALFSVTFFAYIAVGSYIYIDLFGTSPQGYTYFFAVTAAFMALGPYLWIKVSGSISPRRFTNILLAASLVSGGILLLAGTRSVYVFCAALILFSFAQSAIRPYTTNILLSQQDRDTGAASSLINFMFNVCGVLGMVLAVAPWPNYVVGMAVIMLVCSAGSVVLWMVLLRSSSLHIPELD